MVPAGVRIAAPLYFKYEISHLGVTFSGPGHGVRIKAFHCLPLPHSITIVSYPKLPIHLVYSLANHGKWLGEMCNNHGKDPPLPDWELTDDCLLLTHPSSSHLSPQLHSRGGGGTD